MRGGGGVREKGGEDWEWEHGGREGPGKPGKDVEKTEIWAGGPWWFPTGLKGEWGIISWVSHHPNLVFLLLYANYMP